MVEAEKSRLFLHRIPHYLSSEELKKDLSLKFFPKKITIDVKVENSNHNYIFFSLNLNLFFFIPKFFFFFLQPAKTQGGYYCAVVIFSSSVEAHQAFENVNGYQETVLIIESLICFERTRIKICDPE